MIFLAVFSLYSKCRWNSSGFKITQDTEEQEKILNMGVDDLAALFSPPGVYTVPGMDVLWCNLSL